MCVVARPIQNVSKALPVGLVAEAWRRWLTASHNQAVKPRIQKMITFTQMNLASAVYVGRMDLIFCMNVMIYFTEERRRALVQRFYDSLEPGGYLFLGHSESISKMPVKFQAIVLNDCILYRKPTAEELQKSELVLEGGTA